VYKAS